MKFNKKPGFLIKLFLVIILSLLFLDKFVGKIYHPLPYRSLAPFKGKVVDKETNEPISGAVVLALYSKYRYSVAGEMGGIVDAQEVLTDQEGYFQIPRKRRWFVLERGYPEGELVIFKPGYGALPHHRQSEAVGENKSWPPPKKFVLYKLLKLTNIEERKMNIMYMDRYNEIPYSQKKIYWDLINKERKEVKLPSRTPDEKELY
jgi:hypothetical protein